MAHYYCQEAAPGSCERYLSIDVECVATGRGHNDRAVCRVACVDASEATLVDVVVCPTETVFSPLTAITGLSREEVAAGAPLSEALARLRAHLGPDVVLVGQAIAHDIKWLGLEEGVDFGRSVDIAESFKSWNAKYGNFNYFSLRHEAFGLLGMTLAAEAHDPAEDARISIRLFLAFVRPGPVTAQHAAAKLQTMQYRRQFPEALRRSSWAIDGVCGASFNPKLCTCGQPSSQQSAAAAAAPSSAS